MSVRESVEQSEEELNLHHLVLEEKPPKPELVFDPETEILDSDWQGMKGQLDQARQKPDWWNFSWQAMSMKFLDPEKAKPLLNLDDEAWQGMKARLDQFRQKPNWWDFSWQAMKMKILVAEKVRVTETGLEIIMQEPKSDFQEKKPERPVRREF